MAPTASCVVDLAAYRVRRTGKRLAKVTSVPVPMIPIIWTFVGMPVFADHAQTHA